MSSPSSRPSLASLDTTLSSFLSSASPFHLTYSFYHFPSSLSLDRHGNEIILSGSTRKVSILLAALFAVESKKLTLNQQFQIHDQDRVEHVDGVLDCCRLPLRMKLYDLLTLMIIVSDNIATNVVCRIVGLKEIQNYCAKIGLKGTIHRYSTPPPEPVKIDIETGTTTTLNELSSLFVRIYECASSSSTPSSSSSSSLFISPSLASIALDILSHQKMSRMLPALLPPGIKCAHKTGSANRCFLDGGLVLGNEEKQGGRKGKRKALFALSMSAEGTPDEVEERWKEETEQAGSKEVGLGMKMSGKGVACKVMSEISRVCYEWSVRDEKDWEVYAKQVQQRNQKQFYVACSIPAKL